MRAVIVKTPGDATQLRLSEWPMPVPSSKEVLVKVAATALNRADIYQRQGKYPPPPGASPLLGLEISGTVEETGQEVTRWKVGDQVFGLIPGGGYAEYAIIHEDMAIAVPNNISMLEAAAIPEVFLTAFQALKWLGRLESEETVLIHAGASGVGTAAIQLARSIGARVLVTASSHKHDICLSLGAERAINYKETSFLPEVMDCTGGAGVDVVIDFIGANYLKQNIGVLKTDGRLVLLATLSGGKSDEFDLRQVLLKRLQIIGSTLRSRSLKYQIQLTREFNDYAMEKIIRKEIRPIIDSVYSWKNVVEAHQHMELNKNAGKIMLTID